MIGYLSILYVMTIIVVDMFVFIVSVVVIDVVSFPNLLFPR